MAGSFGSGKTTTGCVKALLLASANPGLPGLIIGPTWTTVKAVIMRTMRSLLLTGMDRQAVFNLLKIHDPMDERFLDWGGGTHIFLRSAKNPSSIDGLEVAWVWGDELRHWNYEAYKVTISRPRIRKAPFIQRFFTSTPAMHWMADEYNSGNPERELITVSTRENLKNLDPQYVRGLEQSYSPRLQRAVIDGEFTILEGAVYEAFDSRPHSPWIREYDYTKHAYDRTHLWIDPGFRHPSVLWARQLGDQLKWIVFHQMHPENVSMNELCGRVNAWNKANGVQIDDIWVDPAADSTEQATAVDVMTVLDAITCRNRKAVKWICGMFRGIEFGVEKLRVLLGDPERGQEIRLFVSPAVFASERNVGENHNRGIVKALSAYQYPEHKEGRPSTENPQKDGIHDHACDAARYGAVGLWLTTPLRQLDPILRKQTEAGYMTRGTSL